MTISPMPSPGGMCACSASAVDPTASMSINLSSSDNRILGSGTKKWGLVSIAASYAMDEEDQPNMNSSTQFLD